MTRLSMNLKSLMEKKAEHNPADVESVVEPVEEFFDVDEKQAAEKLADRPLDDTFDLIDGVRRGDKEGVIDVLDEAFSIGSEVKVGGEDGVVKIPNGPGDTVGIMIDGELEMVKNGDVDALNEAILGMSHLPGLNRMMELAGIKFGGEDKTDEAKAEDGPAEAVAEAPAQPAAPEPSATASGPAPAPEVAQVEITSAAPAPVTAEYQPIELPAACEQVAAEQPAAPLEVVRSSLDQIEACMSNLTVAEYREIRDRITKLQNAIFESVSGRPLK